VAFVPIACAQMILAPQGVTFQGGFEAWDPDTNRRRRGVLSRDPIFQAATTMASEALAASQGEWVASVASMSAEWEVVTRLANGSGDVLAHRID
jgi:hypothetical protein